MPADPFLTHLQSGQGGLGPQSLTSLVQMPRKQEGLKRSVTVKVLRLPGLDMEPNPASTCSQSPRCFLCDLVLAQLPRSDQAPTAPASQAMASQRRSSHHKVVFSAPRSPRCQVNLGQVKLSEDPFMAAAFATQGPGQALGVFGWRVATQTWASTPLFFVAKNTQLHLPQVTRGH